MHTTVLFEVILFNYSYNYMDSNHYFYLNDYYFYLNNWPNLLRQQNTLTPSLQSGKTSSNECPDIKKSDREAPVMLSLGNAEYPFIAIASRSTLTC